jgi:diguanylate cyclase (GGDEF)-like protein
MPNLVLFFWLLPVTVAVTATIFWAVSRFDSGARPARLGALAFGLAFFAIVLDTQRQYFPWWFFSLAVPLHWMVVVCIIDAFLSRHRDRIPPKLLWPIIVIGSAVNFGFTFIANDPAIRVPNASIVAVLLVGIGALRLAKYRARKLDRIIAVIISANWLCYFVRTAIWFGFDQLSAYAKSNAFSDYMTFFYFTSGVALVSIALILLLATIIDLTEKNQRDSSVDLLTGTLNRRGLENAIVDAQKRGRPIGAAIMLDLDHFKTVNDTYGHAAGDAVLIEVSRLLRNHVQGFGEIARMGGEEFAVIVYQSHLDGLSQLAEMLRSVVLSMRVEAFAEIIRVTASLGVARLCHDELFSDALRRADNALYQAKSSGRNRVVECRASEAAPAYLESKT